MYILELCTLYFSTSPNPDSIYQKCFSPFHLLCPPRKTAPPSQHRLLLLTPLHSERFTPGQPPPIGYSLGPHFPLLGESHSPLLCSQSICFIVLYCNPFVKYQLCYQICTAHSNLLQTRVIYICITEPNIQYILAKVN